MKAEPLETLLWNERLASWAAYLLVAGMMACLLGVYARFGQAMDPGWKSGYLAPVGFVIALEALYFYHRRRSYDFPLLEWFLFHLAEWGVILLSLRLLIYALRGPDALLSDLSAGPYQFLTKFFQGEFPWALLGVGIVWYMTNWFADLLAPLQKDEVLVMLEGGAGTSIERHAARRALANLVLLTGSILALLTAGMRSAQFSSWSRLPLMRGGVIEVMVYFVLALALLSLAQFARLRARWGLNKMHVSREIASQWLGYTLLLLAGMGLLSLLLPTGYTFGLIAILNILVSILVTLGLILIYLLSIPLALISTVFARLFGTPVIPRLTPPPMPTPSPAQAQESILPFLLGLLQSLLFWGLLLGLVVFSISYYLRARSEHLVWLRRLPFAGLIGKLWQRLRQALRGANQRLVDAAAAGLARLQRRASAAARPQLGDYLNLRRLDNRRKVRFYYLALVRRGQSAGMPRRPSHSPLEYAQELERRFAASPRVEQAGEQAAAGSKTPEQDVWQLTQNFIHARYTVKPVSEAQVGLARQAWERLRSRLRRTGKEGDGGRSKA